MSVAAPLVQISLLGEAIDGAPVAVLVADDAGRYLAANRYACELLGYTREELLTLSVRDVAVGDEVEAHFQDFLAAREQRGMYRVRRKDGTTIGFRYSAGRTMLAGMTCYIAVGVEADDPRERSSAAPTKSRNSGAGRVGRDLNSGWNWLATNQG